MRLIHVGDIVGRSGRAGLLEHLPELKRHLAPDVVVVNGENAAGGYGLTAALAKEMLAAGVDAITLGNHAWDQRELIAAIQSEPRIVRPLNMQPGTPGRGWVEVKTPRGKRVIVMQAMGRLFMGLYDDPFRALDVELQRWNLGGNADAILVDIHAEATSEKLAVGHHLDGRVSSVAGTHTHIPTADAQVLPGGTAYISDLGMTGDYDSVIGMDKHGSLHRWRSSLPGTGRLEPASGEATLCAVYVETDDKTGLATRVEPIRLGGRLKRALPDR